jgi:hypothetical protein
MPPLPPQPSGYTQTVTSVQKSKSPFLKILVGVIVVGGLAYGGWWFYNSKIQKETILPSQTKDETAGSIVGNTDITKNNFIKTDFLTVYYPDNFKVYDYALVSSSNSFGESAPSGGTIKTPIIIFPDGIYSVLIGSVGNSQSPCYKKDAVSFSDVVPSVVDSNQAMIGWYYPKYQDFSHNNENYQYTRCTVINNQTILLSNQNSIETVIPSSIQKQFEELINKITVN